MATFTPFSLPQARFAPPAGYAPGLAQVGTAAGGYNDLINKFAGDREDAASRMGSLYWPTAQRLVGQGMETLGPNNEVDPAVAHFLKTSQGSTEFDPAVASFLKTAENPVNNETEDYFRNKFMADVNSRAASRGLIGQGVGEGMINDASRGYNFGRADTATQRAIAAANAASGIRTGETGRETAAANAANALRTGQINRGLSMTNAGVNTGLGGWDAILRASLGETGARAGQLGGYENLAQQQTNVNLANAHNENEVNLGNAHNQALVTPSYMNALFGQGGQGGLIGQGIGALGTIAGGLINRIPGVSGSGSEGDPGSGSGTGGPGNPGPTEVPGESGPPVEGGEEFLQRGGMVRGGAYDRLRRASPRRPMIPGLRLAASVAR